MTDANPEDAMAKVQGICDALHTLCTDDKDTISALSMKIQKMLEGLPVQVGIGVAVQIMLNGCQQLSEAHLQEGDDEHEEFCYVVGGAAMLAQFTAQAARKENLHSGGIQ